MRTRWSQKSGSVPPRRTWRTVWPRSPGRPARTSWQHWGREVTPSQEVPQSETPPSCPSRPGNSWSQQRQRLRTMLNSSPARAWPRRPRPEIHQDPVEVQRPQPPSQPRRLHPVICQDPTDVQPRREGGSWTHQMTSSQCLTIQTPVLTNVQTLMKMTTSTQEIVLWTTCCPRCHLATKLWSRWKLFTILEMLIISSSYLQDQAEAFIYEFWLISPY